jgi:hypothetical protein
MSKRMYPRAFDIETTGFSTADAVTVVGIQQPDGVWMALNSGGRRVNESDLEDELFRRSGETVRIHAHDNEKFLLEHLREFIGRSVVPKDVYIAAYNGETYRGGFDLKFLRTAHLKHNISWPFRVPYVDVYPPVRDRLNTTDENGNEQNDLVGAYDILIGNGDGDYDPFDDSAEAVDAWEQSNYVDLLAHNLSDVRRSQVLAEEVEAVVPKADLRMKNLAPVG